MDYDPVTFRADLDLLEFGPGTLPTPRLLTLKRSRLAKEGNHDPAALSAAHARLTAWAMRFAEMKLEPPPVRVSVVAEDQPLTDGQAANPVPPRLGGKKAAGDTNAAGEERSKKEIAAAKAAWQAAMNGQQDRHRRRRSGYPGVKPAARPG